MTTPKVNSPSLAQTLKSIGSRVEGYTETLDAISEDIKSVERWLKDSGVRLEVEIVYRNRESVTDPAASVGVGSIDIAGPWRGRRDTAAVAWGPTDSGNAWRLLHRVRAGEGIWEEGEWCWDNPEPELLDARPLIETTAQIRLGLGDALEKLVKAIASVIPVYTQETLIEGDLNVIDQSIPESGTGPWRVYFQLGPKVESITGQRVYRSWNEVLDTVQRLVGPDIPPERLTGHSLMFERLKVPVRVLRELKLM
jgi:hypothetical protein